MTMNIPRLCLCISLLLPSISGSFKHTFPFGDKVNDAQLDKQDDISSLELQLQVPIVFYDQSYSSVFINSNGLISFYTDIPIFFNVQFPMDYPIIAPFYADVDTSGTGTIYYRESTDHGLLQRANNYIQQHFTSGSTFDAKSLLIVTWDAVGSYNAKTDKVNTFQLVIATDGQTSFSLFFYVDIQWIYCEGKSNFPEMRAQAGFMAGDGKTTLIPGSGTDQIRNIHKISNVGDKGLWLYEISHTQAGGSLKSPDLNIGETAISSHVPQTCSVGAAFCHISAKCVDYNPGYCCECDPEYYGNGKSCLKKEEPLRINGKVSGNLNGQKFEDADLHSYVVPNDGRAYTAISRIDETLGYDIQTLLSVGVSVSWLFATETGGVGNGYQITGGILNNTMTIEFPQTGHKATIELIYQGLDVFNNLRMLATIHGTLPSIPFETRIEVNDFSEEYTRISPGTIRSHSTHNYHLEGTDIPIPFTVDQLITFEDCAYSPIDSEEDQTLRLQVSRNYIVYDAREKVIRYAVLASMEPLSSVNPCDAGKEQCGRHSSCVVEGDAFRCICDSGYENIYVQVNGEHSACVDINECTQGKDNCHANADCFNYEGSFACRCKSGYEGDGVTCTLSTKTDSCNDVTCDANAECVSVPGQASYCRCVTGYVGDGTVCEPITDGEDCQANIEICDINADCIYNPTLGRHQCQCLEGLVGNGLVCTEEIDCKDNVEVCDINADCIFNPTTGKHQCQCLEGLVGDGHTCTEEIEGCDVLHNCHPDAICVFDEEVQQHYCTCNPNFKGDGYVTCDPEYPDENGVSCNLVNNCHPNAICVYDTRKEAFTCRCIAGYEGDGYSCQPSDVTCDSLNICSVYGKCVYNEVEQKYGCQCLEGYTGDGILCQPQDDCKSNLECDQNAVCAYDHISNRHFCQCNRGYTGNGKECHLQPDVSCEVINNCHSEAQCTYDSVTLSYVCHCNPGFTGDGYYCEQSVTSCNIINNCHPSAACAYDESQRAYRCQCHQGFTGDGINCVPENSCLNDPSLCDEAADCVPHPSLHQYVCQCREGYFGDGYSCSLTPSYEGNFLLINQGMATIKINLDSTKSAVPVSLFSFQTALGIDVDCAAGQFYWTDVSGSKIMRAEYNGSDPTPFINTNIISPEGIAIDWAGRNIFWTDSGKDTIEVARLDTKERKVIFDTDLINPRGIAVHPGRGKIYWTDWHRDSPKIEQANMDGTNREDFVNENLGLPNLLTIDFEREDLCWADAGVQKIECMNINGHNRRTVVAPIAYPFGVANSKDTLYWTDWETNSINSASKIAYRVNEPIKSPLGTHSRVYGIVYVPNSCPKLTNICAINNGGCKNLCLANGHGGRTCACPDQGNKEESDACNEIR